MNMETVGVLLLLLSMRMFLFLLSIHGRELFQKGSFKNCANRNAYRKILISNLDHKIASIISTKDNKVNKKVILKGLKKEDPNILTISLLTLYHAFINTILMHLLVERSQMRMETIILSKGLLII